jgi:glutamate-ammonia-ligase adenylyltransferase
MRCSRVSSRKRLIRPASAAERAAVAGVLGYPPAAGQELAEDYRRTARRARAVMERLFYG